MWRARAATDPAEFAQRALPVLVFLVAITVVAEVSDLVAPDPRALVVASACCVLLVRSS